jgi:nucleoside-diphosphate-sugar epimerase
VHLATSRFWDWSPDREIHGLVQLAFLTKDKAAVVGRESYIAQNMAIIGRHTELAQALKPRWIALVSSGAVYRRGTAEYPPTFHEDPYGYLKWIEEVALESFAQRTGTKFAIGRLWAAIGQYIGENRAYAVVDFISQARKTGLIRVKSSNPVYREYADAEAFMRQLVSLAAMGVNRALESAGERLEVGDLAALVAKYVLGDAGAIERQFDASLAPDNYIPHANLINPQTLSGFDPPKHNLDVRLARLIEFFMMEL